MRLIADADRGVAFDEAMKGFAPFEPNPRIAVAVSGGPDSMALVVLMDAWAKSRGGSVLGLTVDHGLRAEAAAEAAAVGTFLAARGMAHAVLRWTGDKPKAKIQQAAREARYRLLIEACAARGILHLAVAHHADDQAETVLFRQDHGTGEAGLAGMPTQRSLGPVRLIRPVLGWSKPALIAVCQAAGQEFFDDPSNRSKAFARTGLRERLADGAARDALFEQAVAAGRARALHDRDVAELLGQIAEARPDGAVILDAAGLADAAPALRSAALAACLRAVGGNAYAPTPESVETLGRALNEGFQGVSLAGCVVRPWRGSILICREAGRITDRVRLTPGVWRFWDRRFMLQVESGGFEAKALGVSGYAAVRKQTQSALPSIVAAGLPAILCNGRLVTVPGLGWTSGADIIVRQRLVPLWPLAAETFTVVSLGESIMCCKESGGRY
jgi:tRNA(Ile)-lysidine synthase